MAWEQPAVSLTLEVNTQRSGEPSPAMPRAFAHKHNTLRQKQGSEGPWGIKK
jgi:hypothetical protein